MPRQTFTVYIDTAGYVSDANAVADASAYFATCDTTNTYSYAPTIEQVDAHSDESGYHTVSISFTADIENDAHLKRFMQEMTHLSRVKSVEKGVLA